MKRDMDIVRYILQRTEADEQLDTKLYPLDVLLHHVVLMQEGCLILAETTLDQSGKVNSADIKRLTNAGYDFLDASRDNQIWQMAKEKILKSGASWTLDLLLAWLKQEIARHWTGGPPPVS